MRIVTSFLGSKMVEIGRIPALKTLGLVLLLSALVASAQAPDTAWTKMYGTLGPFEWFQSVEQLADGGYILCGSWDDELLLMKTDPSGDSLWTKLYGGAGTDVGFCVKYTMDGGYIITGLSATASGDLWLLRTDAEGDTIWTKTFGGPEDDIGFWVEPTEDGGFIVCGQTESLGGSFGTWLLKTDSLGDTVWTHVYEGLSACPGRHLLQLADSGFVVTTNILSGTSWDAYAMRTNAQGDAIWTHTYGGSNNEIVTSFVRTDDSGYLLAGYTGIPGDLPDGWLLKIDSLGTMQWTKVYAGAGYEEFRSIARTLDGAYVVCGVKSPSPMGYLDVWLMKIDANGDSVWASTWSAGQADEASDVKSCFDDGYILAGSSYLAGTHDDAWLLKTEPDVGVRENNQQIMSEPFLEITPNPFTQTTNIRFKIHDTRYMEQELRNSNFGMREHTYAHQHIRGSAESISEYQHPELRIYDASGRIARYFDLESCIVNHVSALTWDGTDQAHRRLGSGVYFLELRTPYSSLIKKLIYIE